MALDEAQHKQNLRALGKFGAQLTMTLVMIGATFYINLIYTPDKPWFLVVIVFAAFWLVPRARKVMRMFENKEN